MISSARVTLDFGYICKSPPPKTPIVSPPSFNVILCDSASIPAATPLMITNFFFTSGNRIVFKASRPYEVGLRVPTTPSVFFLVKSFLSPLKIKNPRRIEYLLQQKRIFIIEYRQTMDLAIFVFFKFIDGIE